MFQHHHLTSPHHSGGSGSVASNGTSNTASWPRTPTAWYPSAGATTPMSFGLQPLSPSDGATGISSGGTCTVLGEDLASKKGSLYFLFLNESEMKQSHQIDWCLFLADFFEIMLNFGRKNASNL